MRQKSYITIFTYILLLAGCMAIVLFIDKISRVGSPMGTADSSAQGELSTWEESSETDILEQEEDKTGQREETESGRRVWYTGRKEKKQDKNQEPETEPEEPKGPPKLILGTDLHYMSPKTTDYGPAFERFVAGDDGKVERYAPELLAAFLSEVIQEEPDALILSGDITVNGEKVSHQELAQKLTAVQEAGIQVLVIPGNHDINNPNAATYIGDVRESTDQVTAQEFYEIYHSFGYDQAASRDEYSLSYRYVIDDTHWLLMLDSCQYEPYNKVGGKIKEESYPWIREQYEEAEKAGAVLIPVAHHNLMGESRVYPTDCAIEGGEQLISILQEYHVPLYLSGHLHLQRIKKFMNEPGEPVDTPSVTEAVTASLAIAPCQYSVIQWREDDYMSYETKTVNVSAWAEEQRLTDENLLDFDNFSANLVKKVVSDQVYGTLNSVPDNMKEKMAVLYGQLNYEYCAGTSVERKEVTDTDGYQLWINTQKGNKYIPLIDKMIADLQGENNYWNNFPENVVITTDK